jgi:clorobiocin biosynthesis protein CloN5
MTEREVAAALFDFVRNEFLPGSDGAELSESTPLIEEGILDSLRVMVLLTFIRQQLGADVDAAEIDPWQLRDISSITRMVCELSGIVPGAGAAGYPVQLNDVKGTR